jgi:energy-coupling factor transporter ATP-binding protein EcfA2
VSTSLRARGVTVSHAAATILDRVDLTVSSGDRVAVLGPNGSARPRCYESSPVSSDPSRARSTGIRRARRSCTCRRKPARCPARRERLVGGYAGALVLVSHDREFLARTVDRVVEIDEFSHGLVEFRGGWQAYLDERAAARARAEQAYREYATTRQGLVDRARRQREWARAGAARAANPRRAPDNDKSIRWREVQRSQRSGAKATVAERELARLEQVEEPRDRGSCCCACRRPGEGARWCSRCATRSSRAATFGSGRSTSRCMPATGCGSPGRTAAARPR